MISLGTCCMLGVAMNLNIVHKTMSLLRVAKRADERTIAASRSEGSFRSKHHLGSFREYNHHANKGQMLPYILLMRQHVRAYNPISVQISRMVLVAALQLLV